MSTVEFHVNSASVAQVTRALSGVEPQLKNEGRNELRQIGRIVEHEAEALARLRINNMTIPWSQMRTGVAPRVVYVVPMLRGTKNPRRKRHNFSVLMMNRAMRPALKKHEAEVYRRFNALTNRVCGRFNRA